MKKEGFRDSPLQHVPQSVCALLGMSFCDCEGLASARPVTAGLCPRAWPSCAPQCQANSVPLAV